MKKSDYLSLIGFVKILEEALLSLNSIHATERVL